MRSGHRRPGAGGLRLERSDATCRRRLRPTSSPADRSRHAIHARRLLRRSRPAPAMREEFHRATASRLRPPPLWNGTRYRHDRIRVAYLSADFHSHATAYLIAELFELHDRARFEIVGVSFGAGRRQRYPRAAGRGVRSHSSTCAPERPRDRGAAARARGRHRGRSQGLHPGFPAGHPCATARRRSRCNYLGFPGTIGAAFIDYILADDTVVLPFDQQPFYTEKIVHLPDCYQVNDRQRAIAAAHAVAARGRPAGRRIRVLLLQQQLQDQPPVFDVWMRLLHAVPGSVLWLLRDNAGAEPICAAKRPRAASTRRGWCSPAG